MNAERRFLALMFALILSVPLTGAWYYARESQAKSDARPIDIGVLQTQPQTRVQQYLLSGFHVPDQIPVARGRYEYLLVAPLLDNGSESAPESLAPTIVLRRQRSLKGSLPERVATGVVEGRLFPGLTLGHETAADFETACPTFDTSRMLMFEVDADYRNLIAWNTVIMTVYAIFVFGGVFGWLSRRHWQKVQRRERTRSQVEIQLALSRQDSFRSS